MKTVKEILEFCIKLIDSIEVCNSSFDDGRLDAVTVLDVWRKDALELLNKKGK